MTIHEQYSNMKERHEKRNRELKQTMNEIDKNVKIGRKQTKLNILKALQLLGRFNESTR